MSFLIVAVVVNLTVLSVRSSSQGLAVSLLVGKCGSHSYTKIKKFMFINRMLALLILSYFSNQTNIVQCSSFNMESCVNNLARARLI